MSEIFARSEALLGGETMRRLDRAHVLVVGVGGVGSWCAEALVRTGVGRLTLMDDDVVVESNLNRQCPATVAALGRPKVEAMKERLLAINPNCEVTARWERFERCEKCESFDLVVDAIDSVDCKAQLLLDATSVHVPVVSSMGAALRTDPTQVRVMRFDKVQGDGLAKALRQRFKKLQRYPSAQFPCVCSTEPPSSPSQTSHTSQTSQTSHTSHTSHTSPTSPKGSLMPVTATFGMCLAAEAIRILGGRRRVVVSLGSNVEPRRDSLERALAALTDFPRTRLVAASEIAETEPVDVPDEFRSLKFLNQVAILETGLSPEDFSTRMHAVEDALGRVRTVRNGPRTVDVDLIDYEGETRATPELTLPHPRAMERAFVTDPWKALVRREMKAQRAAVPPEVRAAKSHALCEELLGLVGDAKLVCCYEALRTELDLSEFVAACRARGVEVVFPQGVDLKSLKNPAFVRREGTPQTFPARPRAGKGETFQQPHLTVSGRPQSYVVERAGEVDLWICPGLAFTESGERLGFGGGWYDRFLASAKPTARAYGVAYRFQLCHRLPQGPWDRRLTGVVAV